MRGPGFHALLHKRGFVQLVSETYWKAKRQFEHRYKEPDNPSQPATGVARKGIQKGLARKN